MRFFLVFILSVMGFLSEIHAQNNWYETKKVKTTSKKWYNQIIDDDKKKRNSSKTSHKESNPSQKKRENSDNITIITDYEVQVNEEPAIPEPEYSQKPEVQSVDYDSTPAVDNVEVETSPFASLTQFNKITIGRAPVGMRILQVEHLEKSTLLYMEYMVPESDAADIGDLHYANFFDGTYIQTEASSKKYYLVNSLGMPISTEAEYRAAIFEKAGYTHRFVLEFERIPENQSFDIIEKADDDHAFNFYDVKPNCDFTQPFIPLAEYTLDYPVKEYGRFIKDDKHIFYVQQKGLVLTIGVSALKQYGKYYSIYMDLKNYSGKSVLFSLDNVKACGYVVKETKKDGTKIEEIPLDILSAMDYDSKVKRRQAWNNFFVGLGQGLAAASAGYSSSTTTYSGSSNTKVRASVYSPYSSAHGYGSSYTTAHGVAHTTSYDGSAAYWASQQAAANTAAYASSQESIRESLNEGYVKTNTIKHLVEYSGFFNIAYKKVDRLKLVFKINGADYPFTL